MFACFSINGAFRDSSAVAMMIPVIVLGIPITDTVLAVIRRLRKGAHPFVADREHIHHRLLYLGLNHRQVVLLVNGVSYLWGSIAIVIFVTNNSYSLTLLLIILVTILAGIKKLGFIPYFLIGNKNEFNDFYK